MSRLISQTLLLRQHHHLHYSAALKPPPFITLALRNRSNRSGKLIEIDLDSTLSTSSSSSSSSSSSPSSSSSSSSDGDVEVLRIKNLEDAIHSFFVKKSAPDWLPFAPGSSFWVPPRRRPVNVVELFGRLERPLTQDDAFSFTTLQGWPCLELLVRTDDASAQPVEVASEHDSAKEEVIEVKVWTNSEDSESEEDA